MLEPVDLELLPIFIRISNRYCHTVRSLVFLIYSRSFHRSVFYFLLSSEGDVSILSTSYSCYNHYASSYIYDDHPSTIHSVFKSGGVGMHSFRSCKKTFTYSTNLWNLYFSVIFWSNPIRYQLWPATLRFPYVYVKL